MLTATYNIFCVFFVVRLMGRRYYTDDPFYLFSEYFVQPGRMPIGTEGIAINMILISAAIGSLILPPLGDIFGRKPILEACLVIMGIFSILSVRITSSWF